MFIYFFVWRLKAVMVICLNAYLFLMIDSSQLINAKE